jgi:hypothetical protein
MSKRGNSSYHVSTGAGRVVGLLLFSISSAWGAPRAETTASVVESPLRLSGVLENGLGARLTLDAAAYRNVKLREHLVLTNFALAPDKHVDLELRRVEVFSKDARIVVATPEGDTVLPRPDVTIFSGTVRDHSDSMAFLSLSPHGTNGIIRLGDETFIVSAGGGPNKTDALVYNLTTLPPGAINWGNWVCGVDKLPARGHGLLPLPVGEMFRASGGTARAGAPTRRVVLAIETDWEFTGNLFGGNTAASSAYAATLIGASSEIYTRDVGTELQIGFLRIWPSSNDPWDSNDTLAQLDQFQSHWNSLMTQVERHAVHFLSGRRLGGGVAYLSALCDTGWDYGLSANLGGSFPYPLQDNHWQNWDIFVISHELGHNFGAPHTHNMHPQIDNCAGGDCSVTPNGTIMSYCHTCPGGMANIQLKFHQRIIDEAILPFLVFRVECDLSAESPTCPVAARPLPSGLATSNRHISFVDANPGQQTAIRVTFFSLPLGYEELNGRTMWIGEPREVSENSGAVDPAAAPSFPTYWTATLVCDENAAHVADWSTLGIVQVYHDGIVPLGAYAIEAIVDTCDTTVEANYSWPALVATGKWGDVVKDCTTDPCGPPNGIVNISDVTAVLDKFRNIPGAPIKARCDLVGIPPDDAELDLVISILDVTADLNAFVGGEYTFPPPDPCP